MHKLVMLLTDDDGEVYTHPKWCLVEPAIFGVGDSTFCTGEYFGLGESNCQYKVKSVTKGGITCENCIQKIKNIKAIKL